MTLQEPSWCSDGRSLRFRGKLTVPDRADPLVRQCIEIMNEEMETVRGVTERSGVSAWTIRQWRGRAMPKVRDLQAVLNSMGYELCIRKCAG